MHVVQEEEKRARPSAMGISLAGLQLVLTDLKRKGWAHFSSWRVASMFVAEETKVDKTAFVANPQLVAYANEFGTANVFVAHSQHNSFANLVSALVQNESLQPAGTPPKRFYWIDIFSINQHLPYHRCASRPVLCAAAPGTALAPCSDFGRQVAAHLLLFLYLCPCHSQAEAG